MKSITLALAGMVAFAFQPGTPRMQDSKPAPAPVAAKADVESVDAILKAVYDVISGPAGQPRNWDRFRSLFAPKARLIAVLPMKSGGTRPIVMSPDEYVERVGPHLLAEGFFEREIARHADEYADIVQVFSTYESRHAAADEKPFARGINSVQLMKDKDRWWVVSVFWCEETAARPIPKEYLPK